MTNPDLQVMVYEDYGVDTTRKAPPQPKHIYVGMFLNSGDRAAPLVFDVKKRHYIGNTTMDAQLSLIMANQALAAPGKLVYDPFAGTGSFLMTCAYFGAYTMGSDIDGRQMRGKEGVSIRSNAQQYSLTTKLLDCTTMDLSRHPWRDSCLFDAIVTDPPYGVRAGAKMLGRKDPSKARLVIIDGQPAHLQEDYVPPTQPWEMEDVLNHLVDFAARHLTLYGRLVYWLPTITDEYKEHDVPQHPCLRLVANSVQSFNVWSRRLITMEKVRDYVEAEMQLQEDGGHYGFRNKYFTPNKH